MLFVGGVVLQRQFDGLVVEIDVLVLGTQLDAAACANDESSAFFLGLAGIGGRGGNNLVVVA